MFKMRKLQTIQIRQKLNDVYAMDEPSNGNASHVYKICGKYMGNDLYSSTLEDIYFQNGPRNNPDSDSGVLDCDLLEIVRDRLRSFQNGPFACEYNERALKHIEEALYQMNLRVENRSKRGVLGTMEK